MIENRGLCDFFCQPPRCRGKSAAAGKLHNHGVSKKRIGAAGIYFRLAKALFLYRRSHNSDRHFRTNQDLKKNKNLAYAQNKV